MPFVAGMNSTKYLVDWLNNKAPNQEPKFTPTCSPDFTLKQVSSTPQSLEYKLPYIADLVTRYEAKKLREMELRVISGSHYVEDY